MVAVWSRVTTNGDWFIVSDSATRFGPETATSVGFAVRLGLVVLPGFADSFDPGSDAFGVVDAADDDGVAAVVLRPGDAPSDEVDAAGATDAHPIAIVTTSAARASSLYM